MRQSSKPWEAIGMSRASWYRHGKPTEKVPRTNVAKAAKAMGASSTRTFQRINRVLAADMDLAVLMLDHGWCKPGEADRIVADPVEHRRFRKWLKEWIRKHPAK